MPFKPLVTAGIESLLNTFLYHSPTLKTAHSRLLGKVLHVEVKGFSTSLILVFSKHQVDVLGKWAGNADCTIITYTSVLPKLHNHQQLTTLIRSGELEVQGNIQVVQNFVALADLAEFNPAELLAPYTSDITTEGISKAMHRGTKFLHHSIKHQQHYVAEAITEEWHMAPSPLEVAWFAEETAAIKHAVDALTKQLEKLEAK